MGKLFLFPNLLDPTLSHEAYFPALLHFYVEQIDGLIVESEKAGRQFLRRFLSHEQMSQVPLKLLNEHTNQLDDLLEPLIQGEIWGLISDAGLPCIADPGSELVWQAREKGVQIETFTGPCSLLMALQLSGFSGQKFSFHGYLPRDLVELETEIRQLENQAQGITQIWIEAPYRSGKMLETLTRVLKPKTRLCVVVNLTGPNSRVFSKEVEKWRSSSLSLGKEPAVFLIYRPIL